MSTRRRIFNFETWINHFIKEEIIFLFFWIFIYFKEKEKMFSVLCDFINGPYSPTSIVNIFDVVMLFFAFFFFSFFCYVFIILPFHHHFCFFFFTDFVLVQICDDPCCLYRPVSKFWICCIYLTWLSPLYHQSLLSLSIQSLTHFKIRLLVYVVNVVFFFLFSFKAESNCQIHVGTWLPEPSHSKSFPVIYFLLSLS